MGRRAKDAPITAVRADAYTIPTDAPEAHGTFAWNETTLVVAEVETGGVRGLGHTYAHASNVDLIRRSLARVVTGMDALDAPACCRAMQASVRNIGREGLAATAISAPDAAI